MEVAKALILNLFLPRQRSTPAQISRTSESDWHPIQALIEQQFSIDPGRLDKMKFFGAIGHAGASAYFALMALFGVAPAVMHPTERPNGAISNPP